MKVYLVFTSFLDHDLYGVYANEESANRVLAELSQPSEVPTEPSIEEWEIQDLISKEAQ